MEGIHSPSSLKRRYFFKIKTKSHSFLSASATNRGKNPKKYTNQRNKPVNKTNKNISPRFDENSGRSVTVSKVLINLI